jgi:hypothetical protein
MTVSTTDLDFFDIKNNLKSFLKNQTQFTDYDFDGSAMSTLLDVLAYNTHYNAMTASMSVNEMFIDTAQVRGNVVSLAKSLGYTPRSAKASSAEIILTGTSSSVNIVLPRGTLFKGGEYSFVTLTDYTVPVLDGSISLPLSIKEGKLLSHRYTVTNADQIFEIPNKLCDTSTIRVTVYESSESTIYKTFIFSDNIIDSIGTSDLFFIQEGSNEKHEIYFGDDILGTKLKEGNIVEISYLKTSGPDANDISTFTMQSGITGLTSVTITNPTKSTGGANIESIESIKKNAPYVYTAQNRTVTTMDFKSILNHNFSHLIKDVSVWGGEDNIPPVYGKVFMSILPAGVSTVLSPESKKEIVNGLSKYKLTSIIPEFVDPEYIYLDVIVDYYFDTLKSNKSDKELNTLIYSAIDNYNTETLTKFNTVYYNSDIIDLIKGVDESIIATTVKHEISKDMLPLLNTPHRYVIDFNNSIYNPHYGHTTSLSGGIISSSGFTLPGSTVTNYLEDDGKGNMLIYYLTSDNKKSSRIIGTVDYDSGSINTDEIIISSIVGDAGTKLLIKAQLKSYDVVPIGNNIVTINTISASGLPHSSDQLANLSTINYKTTPSRI